MSDTGTPDEPDGNRIVEYIDLPNVDENPLAYVHYVPSAQRGLAFYRTICGQQMEPRTPEKQAGLPMCPRCTTIKAQLVKDE